MTGVSSSLNLKFHHHYLERKHLPSRPYFLFLYHRSFWTLDINLFWKPTKSRDLTDLLLSISKTLFKKKDIREYLDITIPLVLGAVFIEQTLVRNWVWRLNGIILCRTIPFRLTTEDSSCFTGCGRVTHVGSWWIRLPITPTKVHWFRSRLVSRTFPRSVSDVSS